jgi:hypothetical protein
MASLAVFMSLGGISYAAVVLPANSVGTKQLQDSAVRLVKVAPTTRQALANLTSPAPATLAGPAPIGGLNPRPDPVWYEQSPSAQINSQTPAQFIVVGIVHRGMACLSPTGGEPCAERWGLYVDGKPIPGSAWGFTASAGETTAQQTIVATGETPTLPAGHHQFLFSDDSFGGNARPYGTSSGSPKVLAVEVGDVLASASAPKKVGSPGP